MWSCERCQQQALSFLYDLLDSDERQEMAAHLESCPACQEGLALAKEQSAFLAEAARESYADIVFKAPVPVSSTLARPTSLAMPRARRPFFLNRWAVAASILFILFLMGGILGGAIWQQRASEFEATKTSLAQAKEHLSSSERAIEAQEALAQKEIRAVQDQIDELINNWKKEEARTRKVVKDQWGNLTINGPQYVQAGAKNRYDVELSPNPVMSNFKPFEFHINPMQERKQEKADSTLATPGPPSLNGTALEMRIFDQNQNNALVFQQKQQMPANNKKVQFVLPSDLPITPTSNLAMEILTYAADGKEIRLRDNVRVASSEYMTHLVMDRPLYRPGDKVFFRSLTLERFSLKPAQEKFHLRYRILGPDHVEIFKQDAATELVNQNKAPISGPNGKPVVGVGAGEFTLPANAAEGQYSLIVSEVNERFAEERRSFRVRNWQAPRFQKEVHFHRPIYGAGDHVKINVHVIPLAGRANVPNNVALSALIVVDGVEIQNKTVQSDGEGRATFDCSLPVQIAKGNGTVTLRCQDGSGSETVTRPIPIVVRDLQVEFFPEGGDLVAGISNRVYFQARTPAGKPSDLLGRLMDDKGNEILRLNTVADDREPGVNQGLGRFTFTPEANRFYRVRVDSPIGIDRYFTLPAIKMKGVALSLGQGVVTKEIPVTLQSTDGTRDLLIGAYCRGRLVGHSSVKLEPRQTTHVTIKPFVNVSGVYRITVFEKKGTGENVSFKPLAERLIFRKNDERVTVEAKGAPKSYQPGDRVNLSLEAYNERGEPIPCLATVAVIDSTNAKFADNRTASNMLAHFLLTTEVRNPEDLEYADFFVSDSPKAMQALDLLLGCQGWRRFAEQDPERFQEQQRQARAPVFFGNNAMVPQLFDTEQKELEGVDREFGARALALEKKLADTEKQLMGKEFEEKKTRVELARGSYLRVNTQMEEASAHLRELRAFLFQFVLGGTLLVLLFVGFFLLSVGLQRMSEGRHARTWFTCGFGLLLLLFLSSVIGTIALMGEPFGHFQGGPSVPIPVVNVPAPANPNIVVDQQFNPPEPGEVFAEVMRIDLQKAEQDAVKNAARPTGPSAPAQQDLFKPQSKTLSENGVVERQKRSRERESDDGAGALREEGKYRALLQKHLGRRVMLPPANDPCVVREYAHQRAVDKEEGSVDFSETLFWNPMLVLAEGKAGIHFDLSDAVTRFDVTILAHTLDGRLGTSRFTIQSQFPFRMAPEAPAEVTNTDQIKIPLEITNEQPRPASATVSARYRGLQGQDNPERGINLDAGARKRAWFLVKPDVAKGAAVARFVGKTALAVDAIERRIQIVPDGFPVTGSVSGTMDTTTDHEIHLPESWLPGTLEVQARFYPSPLAQVQSALELSDREHSACLEHPASAAIGYALTLQMLRDTLQMNPPVEKRTRSLLRTAHDRILLFERTDPGRKEATGGFGWFEGREAPDTVPTAYALLAFHDMAKDLPGDDAIIQRTQKFLLDQRAGTGDFNRLAASQTSVPAHLMDAYIVFALTESACNANLDKEHAALHRKCAEHKDPYLLALVALSELNRKKTPEALKLLKELRAFQNNEGAVGGAAIGATGSQGSELVLETTALATLGWMRAGPPDEFQIPVRAAVHWLVQQRRGVGVFGSPHATILALKALAAEGQKRSRELKGGEVQMILPNLQVVAPPVAFSRVPAGGVPSIPDTSPLHADQLLASFSARTQETLLLSARDSQFLRPGKNTISLNISNKNAVPYTLTWSYRVPRPDNHPQATLRLSTKLGSEVGREGETMKLRARLENVSAKQEGMAVAVIGLPAGVELPTGAHQLKDLVRRSEAKGKASGISAWELNGRELVLYWQNFRAAATSELELDLVCHIPGTYRGPPSRAYWYHDAERKFWASPLDLRIIEKE